MKNIYPQKNSCTNIHSSIIDNSQQVGTTPMPINSEIDTHTVVHLCNGVPPSNKKEPTTDTYCFMGESHRHIEQKRGKKARVCTG